MNVGVINHLPDLCAELMGLVDQIPDGRVTTCGTLATALGDTRASRWVGHYLLHHVHTPDCNCHRVVRAGGVIGGYVSGSIVAKREMLEAEGVALSGGLLDLAAYGFDQFATSHPLAALRREQDALIGQLRLTPWSKLPPQMGGIDVSYTSSGDAVAAYVLVDTHSGELVWSATVARPVRFPYVPTYLTFRELPGLLAVAEAARAAGKLAELTLVDGTGILHPRRLGVASHFGMVAGLATAGVTKKLLHGRVASPPGHEMPSPIFDNDDLLGVAIRPVPNQAATLYVSPGQGVDVATAQAAVEAMLRGRRLPEPIYWADRLSRAAARVRQKSLRSSS